MASPGNLKYSKSHEWVSVKDGIAVIGITDHAQAELGDIVYLELPEPGRILQQDDLFGTVESVKAVSDIYSPVGGEVVESNTAITNSTETVNTDPYGNGWLIKVRLSDPSELERLLTADAYEELITE